MGVLKNDVGRASKKTKIIRGVLKLIGVLIIIVAAFYVGYVVNDKQNNKVSKKDNEKTTTTPVSTKNKNMFNEDQVTTKSIGSDGFFENAIEVYVYGNKIDYEYETDEVISITPIEDVAVIELSGSDFNYLLLVNQDGKVIYDFERSNDYYYCSDSVYSSECYKYEVNGNTVNFMVADLGQDTYTTCVTNYDKDVLIEYEITYKNGELSSPKKVSSITGEEYVEKHNIDCSK